MKKYRFVAFLLFGIGGAGFAQTQPTSDPVKETIKTQLINRVDNGYSAGTTVAFLDNGQESFFTYGYANTTTKQPITQQSVFEIGSITKTFTCLLLADLVQKGKLALNDPVEKYLPNAVKLPSFEGQKITFADLASHTSGLPRMPDIFAPKDDSNPYIDYSPKELYAFLNQLQLKRGTGQYEYSNLAMGLLGHTLALISGKSYPQLLQDVICTPLKMSQTNTLNNSPYLTMGHIGTKPVAHWDFDVLAGAGALRSNVPDMLRYLKAQMGLEASPLQAAMNLTQQPLHEINNVMKIGLGWHFLAANNDEIIWHNGGTGGYRTYIGFSKKTNKGIIILTNALQSPDDLGRYFFDPSAKITPVKKSITVPASVLQNYVGTYQIAPGAVFEVKLESGQLFVKLTGQDFLEVYPESETKFFYREVEASISFFKNDQGQVNKMILYQNGREIPATRN
ncbi:MAG: serine hydrolase [Spirosomataceae bacterium]